MGENTWVSQKHLEEDIMRKAPAPHPPADQKSVPQGAVKGTRWCSDQNIDVTAKEACMLCLQGQGWDKSKVPRGTTCGVSEQKGRGSPRGREAQKGRGGHMAHLGD